MRKRDKILSYKFKLSTVFIILGLIILSLISILIQADDNHVHIDQSGANMQMEIDQIAGTLNKVDLSIDGTTNSLDIDQIGNNNEVSWVDYWGSGASWGGDLDGNNNSLHIYQYCSRGSNCAKSDVGFHVWGDRNTVRWGQGGMLDDINDTTFGNDGDEGGGSKLNLDIHGNDNKLAGVQRNGSASVWSAHTATIYLYSDDNEVWLNQNTDGAKTFNLTTNNDDNSVSVQQTGYAAHTGTVTLNGSDPTTLSLLQQGSTAQSYSLTQNCITIGGCSVSVTQGN